MPARSPRRAGAPRPRVAMVTGEAVSPALVNQWLEHYPASGWSTPMARPRPPTTSARRCWTGRWHRTGAAVPIGRPLANLTLYVLDRDLAAGAGRACPARSASPASGSARGYWQQRGADARRASCPTPIAADGRGAVLYRTGDLGRWLPDGNAGIPRPDRRSGQAARFPHRAGRDRGRARRPSGGPRSRRRRSATDGGGRPGACVPHRAGHGFRRGARHSGRCKREQIELWQDLHEDSYRDELLRGDVDLQRRSAGTATTPGQPLPEADMREYVDFTVERILRSGARAGCWRSAAAPGLIMLPLLPHCEAYTRHRSVAGDDTPPAGSTGLRRSARPHPRTGPGGTACAAGRRRRLDRARRLRHRGPVRPSSSTSPASIIS